MRLFVAVNFDDKFKLRIMKIMSELQKNSERGNFSRMQNLHITLQFIGETENIGGAKAALSSLDFDRIPISFNRVSRFRRQGGDICWLGLSEDEELSKLALKLGEELKTRGFGLEDRTFKAHLTLGREVVFKHGFEPESLVLPENLSYTADRVSLMKSERVKGILTYRELYSKTYKESKQ